MIGVVASMCMLEALPAFETDLSDGQHVKGMRHGMRQKGEKWERDAERSIAKAAQDDVPWGEKEKGA
jgi:hypothetical protein